MASPHQNPCQHPIPLYEENIRAIRQRLFLLTIYNFFHCTYRQPHFQIILNLVLIGIELSRGLVPGPRWTTEKLPVALAPHAICTTSLTTSRLHYQKTLSRQKQVSSSVLPHSAQTAGFLHAGQSEARSSIDFKSVPFASCNL